MYLGCFSWSRYYITATIHFHFEYINAGGNILFIVLVQDWMHLSHFIGCTFYTWKKC